MIIDFDLVKKSVDGALTGGLMDYATRVKDRAHERIISGPKTGRIYVKPDGRIHRASAPGESPANDYGDLAKSGKTGSDGKFKKYVLFGTDHGSKMEFGDYASGVAPRPYLRPAAEDVMEEGMNDVVKRIEVALK